MTNSTASISPEEQEQLLQTIEMFEVIVQANPHDCQSMEILKDAYTRLGMKREMVSISRRMAQTHTELGQFSAAIVEYEQILKLEPDNPEVIAALGDAEERMHKASKPSSAPRMSAGMPVEGGGLMTTSATNRADGFRNTSPQVGGGADPGVAAAIGASPVESSEALAKFLIQNRLASEDVVQSCLERVSKFNASLRPGTLALSLIDEIIRRGAAELETVLGGILDRTKFAYIPLEYYDVDRHVAKMLPEELTLGRLMVPFDVMSRTVMIATANPFDAAGKESAQRLLDYHIQWHLASPDAISKVLAQTYRLASGTSSAREGAAKPAEAPAFGEAPIFGEMPAELKVAVGGASPAESGSAAPSAPAPLPDTSSFRLKS